ncbi:MAG TPA: S8 family serine peptidase, partial [Micromonosporaceae bacterium]|nr:S8 family serine peptidase [Micromonosporaceae bacterium]
MRRTLLAALFAGVVAVASTVATATSASAGAGGDYIVMLQPGADSSAVAAQHARAHGATVGHVYRYAIRGYSAHMSATAAARISSDPRVLLVQPDGVVSIAAQTVPTGINRVDAELSPTANINGVDDRVNVDVAIIDTGIDFTHPDLNVHVAGAKNCSTGNSAKDGHGHGTHVAGTVGALDNSIGVVGVAPGARVWPVRVLNNAGSGSWSDIICGIDYVTQHANEIEVANMSLGGSGSDSTCAQDATHQAICSSVAAGVTYAVAAGNSASNANNFVPATFAEVITVSALADFNGVPGGGGAATCRSDVDDTFADFSNFGADVDLIAPGVCILSTWKGGGYN